jgi:hypothetical protein
MSGERKKTRMKEAENESTSLISSSNLGSDEFSIEENVQLARKNYFAMYNTVGLQDLAWDLKIHLG